MHVRPSATLHVATTLDEALDALAERGADGQPIAGGTWIMCAPIRHETVDKSYVGIGRVPELRSVVFSADAIEIGAAVTHAMLAKALRPHADVSGLAEAAGQSANPGVRNVATVGGNLATIGFAAADLVPALLTLDAHVELRMPGATENLLLADYLLARAERPSGALLARIILKRRAVRSAHARLPLRRAGDYPVAILSVAVECDAADRITAARIAVGSVEPVARRWTELEDALHGRRLEPAVAGNLAERLTGGFTGRNGIDAPGWYRTSVLPTLVRRAVTAAALAS